MKVRTLKRSLGSVDRECAGDLRKEARNLDPKYHPMQRAREYTRAVTAAKMDRMFAQPLIGNFLDGGHGDAVTATAISRRSLLPLISGAADGQVKLWDLATRKCMATRNAHSRTVTGVVFDVSGERFYSCSDDGLVHQWPVQSHTVTGESDDGSPSASDSKSPSASSRRAQTQAQSNQAQSAQATWRTNGTFKSIDHHWFDPQFATASDEAVQIWTPERSAPLQTHSENLWGVSHDTVTVVRYNPAERCLLACCLADRGVGLLDTRTGTALKKTILKMRSNDLQWNPMEPMNFVVANEDYNAYTFDMRKLEEPTRIFKGHQSAVMCVAWSPTGREFVTGSYDRTLRIFTVTTSGGGGTSRDIYHTKRMQRVFSVQYTMDHRFIVSGSDDSNLRLWKSRASEQLGQLTTREEASMQYRQALVQKYRHLPEVKRIHKSRKIPRVIKKQTQQALIVKESADRKQANRVKYCKTGEHKFVAERQKVVVKHVD